MLREQSIQPGETVQRQPKQGPTAAAGPLAGPGLLQELERKRQDYVDALARAQEIGAAAAQAAPASAAGGGTPSAAGTTPAASPAQPAPSREQIPSAHGPVLASALSPASSAAAQPSRIEAAPKAAAREAKQAIRGASQASPQVQGNLSPAEAAQAQLSKQGEEAARARRKAGQLRPSSGEGAASRKVRQPAVDVFDEGETIVLEFELPGVDPAEIELLCEDNAMTLRAPASPRRDAENLVQSERGEVEFQRQIPLSLGIEPDATKASFQDGILTVEARKKDPSAGPKRVEVTA